ncbi:adenylate cyclase [Candidatus Poribacteria bacterium]|nr:adenylate cyclase [Candidatus Poribacteria bacterium]
MREIERKFLVVGDEWRKLATGDHFRQGYLNHRAGVTVRVRQAGQRAFLTIKSQPTGIIRTEYEYPIPVADAEHLLTELCQQPLIDKHRYRVCIRDFVWEIDEFHGSNQGLILAEVELSSEDQAFQKPDWIGQEVSADPRYGNASLVDYPYRSWPENGND